MLKTIVDVCHYEVNMKKSDIKNGLFLDPITENLKTT